MELHLGMAAHREKENAYKVHLFVAMKQQKENEK